MILAAIKICTFAKTGRNPIVFNGQGGWLFVKLILVYFLL
jgi:hypothetical protein